MDELLHHDKPASGETGQGSAPAAQAIAGKLSLVGEKLRGAGRKLAEVGRALCPTKEKLRAAGAGVSRAAAAVRGVYTRHPISPLFYLVVAALAVGVFLFRSTYIKAYAVSVNGVELGLVASEDDMETAVGHVESRVAQVVGTYDYPAEVTYTPVYSTEDSLTDPQLIEDYLYQEASSAAIMDVCVFYVNGQEMGLAASEADVQAMLDRIAAPYLTDHTVDYGFVEDISFGTRQMSTDTTFDLDPIYEALTANSIEEAVYVVEKGDTFTKIAKSLDMTVDQLSELNPDVVIDKIWVGDELIIQRSVPFLSVWTMENVTYEQVIESPVEYTDTDRMYKGETKVTVQGEDGLAEVNSNVRFVNGYQEEEIVLSTKVLQEPTTTEILRGTKPKPKTSSKGTYKWPVSGRITSRYGYRRSGFHTGLDIAVPIGTTVKAADGGTVTRAGWGGGYGWLVVITHDNGSQTYYAHNSRLLVSVGDKVYQGQAIAKSGSTGNSTGPHCHFEIRIGGKTKNPLNYL